MFICIYANLAAIGQVLTYMFLHVFHHWFLSWVIMVCLMKEVSIYACLLYSTLGNPYILNESSRPRKWNQKPLQAQKPHAVCSSANALTPTVILPVLIVNPMGSHGKQIGSERPFHHFGQMA